MIYEITEKTLYVSFPTDVKNYFRDLNLTDPEFHKAHSIDILLKVNLKLLNGSVIKRSPNLLFAVDLKLGWIIEETTFLVIK